ncbi:MAG: pyrroloquinoline quinone biosynthesis protein PqqE [Nevskiaceae bacterium]|nr:MAG: pyrroloquinoline quinone biosynthesis protein PqqE [Nevskiaceae bacterium]
MTAHRPYTLIAELSYRCPLQCVYCSNPLDLRRRRTELATADWLRAFREAEAMGVVQVSFSGGEPLLRDDLEDLVAGAHAAGLYVNLATSGVPLKRERLLSLKSAGLDNVQISIQDTDEGQAEKICGGRFLEAKLQAAAWVKEMGLPLTINVVLHRQNLDRIDDFVALAERLHADRLELANTQYQGWALPNRAWLLPNRHQLEHARSVALAARERLKDRMEVLFVLPDYFSETPKPCMGGWGQRFILIAPDGLVLPCHQAHTLPGLSFANLREHSLRWIWDESPGFVHFRGEQWMQEPCRSCERRKQDFGGCRCQAWHLTGDAAATDPTCHLSPNHALIVDARETGNGQPDAPPVYRTMAAPSPR